MCRRLYIHVSIYLCSYVLTLFSMYTMYKMSHSIVKFRLKILYVNLILFRKKERNTLFFCISFHFKIYDAWLPSSNGQSSKQLIVMNVMNNSTEWIDSYQTKLCNYNGGENKILFMEINKYFLLNELQK